VSSLPDLCGRVTGRLFLLLCLSCAQSPVQAGFELHFETLTAPAITLDDVRVSASTLASGKASVSAARAIVGGRTLHDVRLDCTDFAALPFVRCRGGVLRARGYGPWRIEFAVTGRQQDVKASLQIDRDMRIGVSGSLAGARPHLNLKSSGLELARVLGDEVALKPYVPAGRVDVEADLEQTGAGRDPVLSATLRLSGGRFASQDGLRAGDALEATVKLDARRDGGNWLGQMSVDWRGGEFLWDSIYLTGGGSVLSSGFTASPAELRLNDVALDLAGVGRLTGDALFARDPLKLRSAAVQGRSFDLRALNERFINPLLSARGWPQFVLRGRADVAAVIDDSGLSRTDVSLRDAELGDAAGRYALSGLDADMPWQRDAATAMRFAVASAHFGRIPLGSFEMQLDVAPDQVAVRPVRIPVLDAGLRLDTLRFDRTGGRWNGDLSLDLEPVSMPLLTEALGWPRMAGSLGASVPHVRWRDGVLSLDGQMLIRVFDGYVAASGLQVIEPFGATPRVLADLQMRYVDLDPLTETFKFGRITGRLDGDINGLELSRWVPVSFDARIRSSDGDYPRTISQRAVESITALGGPGAAAAIQRSFLGFFERFGYRRMGMSCRLRNGVCEMDGLADKGGGFVLIEGGGVPALSVVGYNRRVDWQELLERLARVTDTKPLVQ
jgi:hypothetical protein